MLSVSSALNCGPFRTFMDAGKEGVYAEQGYPPMFEARQLAQPFDTLTARSSVEGQVADAIGT